MRICEPIYDFHEFLQWFGNARDYVDIDIEAVQDAIALGNDSPFPFSEEELTAWQQAGLIRLESVSVKEDFKPYQRIWVLYYRKPCRMI